MYSVNQNTQDVVSDKSAFSAGLHLGVLIDPVFEQLSEDKDAVLQIKFVQTIMVGDKEKTFENKEVIWPVDENNVKSNIRPFTRKRSILMPNGKTVTVAKGESPEPAVAVADAYNRFNSRIKHILGVFFPESECIVSGKNYADFCKNFIKKLEPVKDVPFKILIEFDSDGKYTQVPKYGAFMERLDVAEEHSELQKRIDRQNINLVPNRPQQSAGTTVAPGGPPAPPASGAPLPPAPPAPPTPPVG